MTYEIIKRNFKLVLCALVALTLVLAVERFVERSILCGFGRGYMTGEGKGFNQGYIYGIHDAALRTNSSLEPGVTIRIPSLFNEAELCNMYADYVIASGTSNLVE